MLKGFKMTTTHQKSICIIALVSAACTQLVGTPALPTYGLEPVVVVAPNVLRADAELYREHIVSAKPVDLAAILSSQLPAAALTRKGPLAGDIVLRGFSRDNITITVDGNKTFCACPNRMDPPAFHVSSQQIVGISVRTGPFSVDQGSSLGGSIAVRTKAPGEDSFFNVYGYYGSFDYVATGLTAGFDLTETLSGLGGVYYQKGGVYEDGSGVSLTDSPGTNYLSQYTNADAFEVITAELKTAFTFQNQATLTVNYAYQDAQDVLYPGLQMDAPKDTMNRASIALRFPLEAALADSFEASLAFSQVDHDMRDSFRTSLNNMGGAFVERGYFMRTEAESAFYGGRLDLRKEFTTDTLLRYGFDFKRRLWDANNIIGMQRNDMLPDTVTDGAGLWAVYERRLRSWALETGFRLDAATTEANDDISFLQTIRATTSNKRNDILPSAYVLISKDLNDDFKAHAGVGLASRSPDPQERYMNLNRPMANPDWIGNPDLEPVRNLEIQAGLQWQKNRLKAQLNVFHAWLFDAIYLAQINVAPGGATSYENIDARLYGFSADASWAATDFLHLEAGIAWQEGVKESRPENATNDVFGEIPPLRARLAALFKIGDFTAKIEAHFQEDLDRLDPDLGEVPVEGWAILNLAASYRLNQNLSISAGVDNVLDETYAVSNSFVRDPFRSGSVVNEPGRFWFARAGLEF
jgi:iron complex outermembrane recepter protein